LVKVSLQTQQNLVRRISRLLRQRASERASEREKRDTNNAHAKAEWEMLYLNKGCVALPFTLKKKVI